MMIFDESRLADRYLRLGTVAPFAQKKRLSNETWPGDVHLGAAKHITISRPYYQLLYIILSHLEVVNYDVYFN